jgi:hypothetical protein
MRIVRLRNYFRNTGNKQVGKQTRYIHFFPDPYKPAWLDQIGQPQRTIWPTSTDNKNPSLRHGNACSPMEIFG